MAATVEYSIIGRIAKLVQKLIPIPHSVTLLVIVIPVEKRIPF